MIIEGKYCTTNQLVVMNLVGTLSILILGFLHAMLKKMGFDSKFVN